MTKELTVIKVWVDAARVYAEAADGFCASYAFSDWDRLANATDAQRRDFYLSPSGIKFYTSGNFIPAPVYNLKIGSGFIL